ncbi:MAG: bifunctional riboflavin kinase/FAD synthetase [Magnetovibrio sp.]|nr:bifunctional riboflavin kinase/FAD synthetase [Magnetovibrio sp.]
MRIYRHYQTLPDEARGAAIAIGNFDGVHLGHQAVIGEAGRIARDTGAPWAVLTFEPHPRRVFQPDQPPFRLTPFRAKARALEAMGVDAMIVQRFNRTFSQRPAEDFVRDVLVDGFGARHVVAGYDFVFGHNRGGNCEMLLAMGQELGFGFTAVSAGEAEGGAVYSSTGIRDCLRAGDMRGAAAILGRPFAIEGRVASGDKRGRQIGFPTLNLHLGSVVRPALGVYAVRAGLHDGGGTRWIDGVANVGKRPTFGGEDVILEAHLLDFDGDLYGQLVVVSLIEHIRAEKRFDGVDALRAQIAADTERAREILGNEPAPDV